MLTQAKVDDFKMTLFIKKDILWLKVTINNIKAVKIFQGQNQFSCIELALRFRKINLFNQMMTEILATAIIKSKVNVVWGLESKMKTDYKRMINLLKNVDF